MGNDAGDDEIGDAQAASRWKTLQTMAQGADDDDEDDGEPAPGHACLTRRPEDLVDARSSMRRSAQPSHALACVARSNRRTPWPASLGLRT